MSHSLLPQVPTFSSSLLVYSFLGAAITKYQKLDDLKQQNVSSLVAGDWKSEVKVSPEPQAVPKTGGRMLLLFFLTAPGNAQDSLACSFIPPISASYLHRLPPCDTLLSPNLSLLSFNKNISHWLIQSDLLLT